MTVVSEKCCVFESSAMRLNFSLEQGVRLEEIFNKKSNRNWLTEKSEVFSIEILGERKPASEFTIVSVQALRDKKDEGFSIDLRWDKWGIDARIIVISDEKADCAIFLKLGGKWPDSQPQEVYFGMPFIKNFRTEGSKWRLSAKPAARRDGSSVMTVHQNYPMPACVLSGDDRDGFALRPYEPDTGFGGMINLTYRWFAMTSEEEFVDNRIKMLLLDNHPLYSVCDFKITAVEKGWEEAFSRWREDMRHHVNLREYEREDLRWLREAVFPAYTFSYSRQIYDYERQRLDIDQVLDRGDEIGGFDAVILWHLYPRLGVDYQGQFDFNHNLPGGIDGLRKLIDRAHARNVKVILPHNPWDDTHITQEQAIDEMVELVRATDCDGFLLDTMETVPLGLRQKIDAVKKGVGFISEAAPVNNRMLEIITAHQDQSLEFSDMPQSFVLRYLYPEMNCFTTGRWRVGEGKDMLIDRMVFNGTGMLVWEEVFGRWLPLSGQHIEKLRKWRKILETNKDLFCYGVPVPFWTVYQDGLYANRFMSADGRKAAFSIYNESDRIITGNLLNSQLPGFSAIDVWNDVAVTNCDGIICASIAPKQTLMIIMKG